MVKAIRSPAPSSSTITVQSASAEDHDADAALLTEVLVDDDGHEQFFAARDSATGVQFGFISRTGHRVGISAAHVLALFDALEHD